MIGLYCSHQMIAFAMGVWYLASSLSNIISSQLAQFVALPEKGISPMQALNIYKHYYFDLGMVAVVIGMFMWLMAILLSKRMQRLGITLA